MAAAEATSDGEYADEISLRVDSAVLEVDALMKEQRGDVLAAREARESIARLRSRLAPEAAGDGPPTQPGSKPSPPAR
jgi:hypothetical protein